MFTQPHLLGLEGLQKDELLFLLDTAESFREISEREVKKVPTLRGKTVINLFYESSTRTRTSFEIAAKRLSADAINITAAASSVTKGETLLDTARNLIAMRPAAIVIRHPSSGAPHFVAQLVDCPVINAGDGTHEHPTQALLDMHTIRERKGKIAGLTVAIVGDILHSRVARSNVLALTTLGCNGAPGWPTDIVAAGMSYVWCGAVYRPSGWIGRGRCGDGPTVAAGTSGAEFFPQRRGVRPSFLHYADRPRRGAARCVDHAPRTDESRD